MKTFFKNCKLNFERTYNFFDPNIIPKRLIKHNNSIITNIRNHQKSKVKIKEIDKKNTTFLPAICYTINSNN